MSKTIDDFRNFFKPNKQREETRVEDVVSESIQIIGKSLQYHDIELIIESDENIPKINTYSREILQILINLLKNAKEALVENNVSKKIIHVQTTSDKENVILSVSDNAGGIKEMIIDKIFEPYFSTKDEKNGTGLGLYMSKTIAQKHLLGSLVAYNVGAGACFKLTIPINVKSEENRDAL